MYPILRQRRYEDFFSLGLLTTSGSLGLLFPPSLPIILYGVVAQVDIGIIYKAALIPGIILVVILSLYAFAREILFSKTSFRKEEDGGAKRLIHGKQLKQTFMEGIWDWPVVIIILVGVFGGFVTIAEGVGRGNGLCHRG